MQLMHISAYSDCRTRIIQVAQPDRLDQYAYGMHYHARVRLSFHVYGIAVILRLWPFFGLCGEMTCSPILLPKGLYIFTSDQSDDDWKSIPLVDLLIDPQPRMAVGALEPPAGIIPDFESKSYYSRVLVTVLLPVTSAFVVLRTYLKMFVLKSHGWEDCRFSRFFWNVWHSQRPMRSFTSRYESHCVGKRSTLGILAQIDLCWLKLYQLGLIVFSVCVIQGEKYGSGVHQWNVSMEHYRLWAEVKDPNAFIIHYLLSS